MNPISAARLLVAAGALALPLWADGSLITFPSSSYNSTGNYGRAYDAHLWAGRMAIDGMGNLYLLDGLYYPVVRKITPDGTILPVLGYGRSSVAPGERTPAILQSFSSSTVAIALDPQGDLFVGFWGYSTIFRISPDGQIQYYASMPAGSNPAALAADGAGNLYVLVKGPAFFPIFLEGSQVLKISPDGTMALFAGTGTAGYSGDGGPAVSAQIDATDLAVDANGNLFISDDANYLIRKVDSHGIITSVAHGGSDSASSIPIKR